MSNKIGFGLNTKWFTDKNICEVHHFPSAEYIEVVFDTKEILHCGPEQLFWCDNGEWVEAINSKDDKYTFNGHKVIEIVKKDDLIDLFDISIATLKENERNFDILFGDWYLIVHNKVSILAGGVYLAKFNAQMASLFPTVTTPTTTTAQDTTIYIPQTVIQFTVSRMKPNTRLYALFDGKPVSQYIQPTGLNYNDALYTDSNGYASGNFQIPNNTTIKFAAGQRELILCDTADGKDSTTSSSAYYVYTGNATNPDNPNLDSNAQGSNYGAIDPLIQSFVVNSVGGMYVSRIGLFFYNKDPNESLLFQIREVSNNIVQSNYIPGTSLTIAPSAITTSTDPLNVTPTWITLSNPVYLSEGKEYAIYLVTNSSNYILHKVSYGQQTNNITATKDISSRSLIKYLGIDNWVRDDSNGLKYVIQKGQFDSTQSYQIQLGNVDLGTRELVNNSLKITTGTPANITVTDPKHSFNVGSYVTINGLATGTYAGLSSTVINGVHQITSVTWDTYSFNNYFTGTQLDVLTPLPTATTNLVFGTNITTDFDYQYDEMVLNINSIQLSGSYITYQYLGTSGQSLDGSEDPYDQSAGYKSIEPKTVLKLDKVKKISSPLNTTRFNIDKSLSVIASIKTDNPNITPMLDRYNSNVIVVENSINNLSSNELSNNNNDACARYITKVISLFEQGTGLKVTFNAAVQANSNVKVYYKALNVDETGSIDSKNWTLLPAYNNPVKSLSDTDFQKYEFQIDGNNTDTPLTPFRAFKIKVVMTSNDSTKVPLIQKFAAVAFAA